MLCSFQTDRWRDKVLRGMQTDRETKEDEDVWFAERQTERRGRKNAVSFADRETER